MSTILFGGFANGVPDAHAADIRLFFRQIRRPLYGSTNGDLIDPTMRTVSTAFVGIEPEHLC